MSPELGLALGMVLYAAGALGQIAEEWPQRGLTDTSFRSLVALTLGPALMAWATARLGLHPGLAIVMGLPAVLAALGLALKFRDVVRRHYRLWLVRPSRRRRSSR